MVGVVFVWSSIACFLVLLRSFILEVAIFFVFYSVHLVLMAALVALCYVAPRPAFLCLSAVMFTLGVIISLWL